MPLDPRDYKVELSGDGSAQDASASNSDARPFIGVQFACCGVYTRIYRSADGAAYRGRCPRCGKPVNFVVGPGGTDARTFIVE
jgi:hypothetical protein